MSDIDINAIIKKSSNDNFNILIVDYCARLKETLEKLLPQVENSDLFTVSDRNHDLDLLEQPEVKNSIQNISQLAGIFVSLTRRCLSDFEDINGNIDLYVVFSYRASQLIVSYSEILMTAYSWLKKENKK